MKLNKTYDLSKRVAMHPDHDEYLNLWSSLYENVNYNHGIVGYFLQKSHEWAESYFQPGKHFEKVLEVGSGTGTHLKYIRHSFEQYHLTDLNPPFLDKIELEESFSVSGKVVISMENATNLSFPDNSFDRVISAHLLEHLYRPHEVIHEWVRVLKPRGTLTLLLPCDPGMLWRFGRYSVVRNKWIKAGIDYDYWMAREHVNPINNLVSFVRYYFPEKTECWMPTRIPSIDINLFYIAHIVV